MKRGPAAVAIATLAIAGHGLELGCSREARPAVQPDERPPLPPASGTPIGYLVDGARELQLSDDQLGRLKVIDGDLAGQLNADDSELRPEPVATTSLEEKPRGLGFRAGGRDRGVGAEQTRYPGSSGGNSSERGSGQTVISAATVGHVSQLRARHVRDAIKRALGLLDPGQQVIARRLLVDHGVDPDTGEVSGGDPGTSRLADPKLGQPLPREP
jgi:hypothetical protein